MSEKKSAGTAEKRLLLATKTRRLLKPLREGSGPEMLLYWSSKCSNWVSFWRVVGRVPWRLRRPIWIRVTRLLSEHLTRAHLHGSGSDQPGGLRLFLRASITEASSSS